jgi:hypothetical protein
VPARGGLDLGEQPPRPLGVGGGEAVLLLLEQRVDRAARDGGVRGEVGEADLAEALGRGELRCGLDQPLALGRFGCFC